MAMIAALAGETVVGTMPKPHARKCRRHCCAAAFLLAFAGSVLGVEPGAAIGPFTVGYALRTAGEPGPGQRAAAGPVEDAIDLQSSQLRLIGWRGDDGTGKRSMGIVRLLSPNPADGMWLGVDAFELRLGTLKDGEWSWVPHKTQDAHLLVTLGTIAPGADPVDASGHYRANALVLDFALRHDAKGKTVFTVSPDGGFSALVQVPAGSTLGEARKDPANRLADLSVLTRIAPGDGDSAFRLRCGDGGWHFEVDIGRDTTIDVALDGTLAGCRPATIDLAAATSLHLQWNAEGGVKAGMVARSTVDLWYKSKATAVTDAAPAIDIPSASAISPLRLHGAHQLGAPPWTVSPLRQGASGSGCLPPLPWGRWADEVQIHLDPAAPLAVRVANGAAAATGAIVWAPTELPALGTLPRIVLVGDSLLIVTGKEPIDYLGPGATLGREQGGRMTVRFDQPGRHLLRRGMRDGAAIDRLEIEAMNCLAPGAGVAGITAADVATVAVPPGGRTLALACIDVSSGIQLMDTYATETEKRSGSILATAANHLVIHLDGPQAPTHFVIFPRKPGEITDWIPWLELNVIPLSVQRSSLGPEHGPRRRFRLRMDPWDPDATIRIDAADSAFADGKRSRSIVCRDPVVTRVRWSDHLVAIIDYELTASADTATFAHSSEVQFPRVEAVAIPADQR